MSYYKVEFRNAGKSQSMVIKEYSSWAAENKLRKKFPLASIIRTTEINKYSLPYSQRSKVEEAAKVSSDFLDGMLTTMAIDAAIDAFSSSSSSSDTFSSVVDTVSDFASGVADAFDGGGSFGGFD